MNKRTLMLILVAAATLNVTCWWIVDRRLSRETTHTATSPTDRPASIVPSLPKAQVFEMAPTRVTQSDFMTNRTVELCIQFNYPIVKETILPNTLKILDGQKTVRWNFEKRQVNFDRLWIVTTDSVFTNTLTVTVARGIEATIKSVVTSAKDETFRVPISNEFGINRVEVEAPSFGDPAVRIGFTKMVDPAKISDYVVCNPPVKLSFDCSDISSFRRYIPNALNISGAFKSGTMYTLTFRKGLRSYNGYTLDTPLTRSFVIPRRAPSVGFATVGRYLPPEGGLAIPVHAVNTTNVEITVAAVLPQNLVQLMARENNVYRSSAYYRDYWSDGYQEGADSDTTLELCQEPVKGTILMKGSVDSVVEKNIRLTDFMSGVKRGVFLVTLKNKDTDEESPNIKPRLICVSDIGLSARIAENEIQVWVTSLRNGAPVADASVQLFASNNSLIASGKSSHDGVARIPLTKSTSKPFLVTATTADGTDQSFIPLSGSTQVDENIDFVSSYLQADQCTAFVFADRGLYRHGEPIHLQALLRNPEASAPQPFPVVLKIEKPDGKIYKSLTLMPDARGAVLPSDVITIPEDQPSGEWIFRLSTPGDKGMTLGICFIKIESFVPPQLRVSVNATQDDKLFDKPLSFGIHAEHLFGNPAAGLKVEATVTYVEKPFDPVGWKAYSFGDGARTIRDNYQVLGKGTFDSEGNATFSLVPDSTRLPSAMISAIIEGTAFETGGRPVSVRNEANLHIYPIYIGLKTPASRELMVSQTNTLSIAAVDFTGKRADKPRPLEITLSKLTHIYGYTQNDQGDYLWKDETIKAPVSTDSIVTTPDTDVAYTFAIESTGEYRITVNDPATQASTAYTFNVTDGSQSSERSSLSNPAKVELSFDKHDYVAGDTAKLRITSPFLGSALFSLERNTIIETRVFTLTNTTTVLDIPVTREMYPNIQATISVIRPAEIEASWSAHRASGVAVLKVSRPENKLAVVCQPSAEIIQGGSKIHLSLDVSGTDATNACYATLYVTDEALHLLTNQKTPDPYSYFSQGHTSDIAFYDLFRLLMPITADTVSAYAARIGGDGDSGLSRRISPIVSRRFKPLSLAIKNIRVIGGHAEETFILPEFAGEVRVTAVVWNSTASGSTSKTLKVTPKLVARPDAPRFLACGDKTSLTLTLHNQSGADCEVNYQAAFSGPLSGDTAPKSVILKAGESQVVSLFAKASDQPGNGQVTFTATGAGETHVETIDLPIRPAMPLVTTTECTVVHPGKSLVFSVPQDQVASTVAQSLRGHDSSFSLFIPALSYLLDYPYGCLEQTTSSAFPLIYAGGTLTRLLPADTNSVQETREKIYAAIVRISAMQSDRGFYVWYDIPQYNNSTTVYACHFLAEAAQAGYAVQKQILEQNDRILNRLADSTDETMTTLRTYCCEVLALSGKPNRAAMLSLYDDRDNLSPEGLAHLSRAFSLSGDRGRGLSLMKAFTSSTSLESTAFGILAWIELDAPESATRAHALLAQLIASRNKQGHWGTTHNNAIALLAIGALAQRQGDATSRLDLDFTTSDGTSLGTITNSQRLIQAKGQTITVQNKGKGDAYVSRTWSAVPLKTSVTATANGLSISRRYQNPDGVEINPAELSRGDEVIVELTIKLDPETGTLADAVVEELLPACLEPETESLAEAQTCLWVDPDEEDDILRREVRDDRLLFFLNPISKNITIHYAARVVSAGEFTVPPASIEGMYRPEVNSRTEPGSLTIGQ